MVSKKQNFENVAVEHNAWKMRRDELLPQVKEARDEVLENQAEMMEKGCDKKLLESAQKKLTDLEQKKLACEHKMEKCRIQLEKIAREELVEEIAHMEKQEVDLQAEREVLIKEIAHHLAVAQAIAERSIKAGVFSAMLDAISYKSVRIGLLPYDDLIAVYRTAFTEALHTERAKDAELANCLRREEWLFRLRIMADNTNVLENEIISRIFKAIGQPEEPEKAHFQPIFMHTKTPEGIH